MAANRRRPAQGFGQFFLETARGKSAAISELIEHQVDRFTCQAFFALQPGKQQGQGMAGGGQVGQGRSGDDQGVIGKDDRMRHPQIFVEGTSITMAA